MNVIFGFSSEHAFLSNFFVESDGLTGEHRFQAEKTADPGWRQKILSASTPGEAKHQGRIVPLRNDWEAVKIDVMRDVVAAKFDPTLHPEMAARLIATGSSVLIEANKWGDTFWGVDETTGAGENNLGRILMHVRHQVAEVVAPWTNTSARPSASTPPGPEPVPSHAVVAPSGRITVATDGSAAPTNPGPSGWAWYVNDDCWAAGGRPDATNNRAELAAVLNLFLATSESRVPLHILIDSKYVIGILNGNKAVANAELVARLREAAEGRDYTIEWVKGHAGHPMNEAVDARCTAASLAVHEGAEIDRGPGWTL